MRVKDLIRELEKCDPNLKVHFQYNYGDHSRTQVAPEVEHVREGGVEHSEYHDMPKVIDHEGTLRLKPGQQHAVILR